MADQQTRLQYLFQKFIDDTATPDEIREFWKRFAALKKDDPVEEAFIRAELQRLWHSSSWDNESEKDWTDALKRLHQQAFEGEKARPLVFMRKRLAYVAVAAAALLLCAGVYLLYSHRSVRDGIKTISYKNDVLPGSNGAILTLADGKKIVLDSTTKGMVAQGNQKITYKNGCVQYAGGVGTRGEMAYNTMTTDRGHQYQIVLSDGSKVWLNAASSIRYPARFAEGERKVEITGEAYFEVSGSAKSPFMVTVSGAEVKVLGTHFNINAYTDESTVKTSLLEGSVKVSRGDRTAMLTPGQQAEMGAGNVLQVAKMSNPASAAAWKNGYFSFDKTDIQTVMRQLSRWYNIDVSYEGGRVPPDYFWGDLQRNAKLSDILTVLAKSGISFTIEGNKVLVLNKH